ncbi:MAG: c-type cytochrome [Planctomycetota bacterium]
MKRHMIGLLAALALPIVMITLPACGGGDAKKGPEISDENMKLAKAHFNAYCSTCHGQSGKGDGPAGVALDPKPRNWTDKKWQESVDDAHIAKVIREGGQSVGLSPLMAANPTYGENPDVIAALVQIVRSYGK